MKVLVADKFPDSAVDKIKKFGVEVIYEQNLKDDSLLDAMKEKQPNVVVVRSTKVTGPMIQANPDLSLIIRAGAGFNTIDVGTASLRGVYVANCPGKNAIAVAELAMGHIMSIDRRIPDCVIQLRDGKWDKAGFSKAEGIYGSTLGIIGTGRIGQEVIIRAKAFGMKVIAWSRSLTSEMAAELGIERCASITEVASRADYVSLHLALTDDTRGMIDSAFFGSMKAGAALINTSRAEIVDQDALLNALDNKGIRAGLDVFADEPSYKEGEFVNRIAAHPSVFGTHHIGASTNQAQLAVAEESINIISTFLATGLVLNCVNLIAKTPAKYVLSVRHRNRVGVLADVLRIVRENEINVEKMENIIFAGAEGACANIQIDDELSSIALDGLRRSSDDIYDVNLTRIE
ncbi:MAG: hypothetical protein JEY99_13180 [Spirochaetales bacterium]|nr:hypothetical protein [Spirochaetales bacterium]